MTPLEIMAFMVAIFAAIKLIVVLINPKLWMNYIAKKFWGNTQLAIILSLMISIISLRFLLKELTIIHIFAVMLFTMFMIAIGFAPYSKDMLTLIENKMRKEKNIWKRSWLAIIIWIILLIWVTYALFV